MYLYIKVVWAMLSASNVSITTNYLFTDLYTSCNKRNFCSLSYKFFIFKEVMTGRCEASIDLICDWLLDERRENLKSNMHFYLMITIIIYYN